MVTLNVTGPPGSGSVVGVSIQVAVGASPPADYSGILERVKAAGNDTRFELLR